MKISTNWLKDYVKIAPPVEKVAEDLTMAGLEVEKISNAGDGLQDAVFDIEITTNRPDWLSHLGVAREIAAVRNLSLKIPPTEASRKSGSGSGWKVYTRDTEGCPYYSGILIEGIENNETPDFMKERLLACGIRSIDLIVDITNFVLLETGQPLHAFDADALEGRQIRVRRAKKGEKMTAIDGAVLELSEKDLVIADEKRPVALAGVMGGKDTEVSQKTRNIFLESAYFQPRTVRYSSKVHGIASESSYRFERKIDPEGVDFGRQRAVALIKKYAKPRFIGSVLTAGQRPSHVPRPIRLNQADVDKVLGVEIKSNQISSFLTRLGLHVTNSSAKSWTVKVPSFRSDLLSPIDLIEEIARLYGYDNIPETLPAKAPVALFNSKTQQRLALGDKFRELLVGSGFYEAVTFSLISSQGLDPEKDLKEAVCIVNPQNKELKWMRPTFCTSLLNVIQKNVRAGTRQVLTFELGSTYHKPKKGKHPEEQHVLAIALHGPSRMQNWLDGERNSTYYDVKGVVESLLEFIGLSSYEFKKFSRSYLDDERCEEVFVGKHRVGLLGEVSKVVADQWGLEQPAYYAELSLDSLIEAIQWIRPLSEIPKFPSTERDLSVTVSEGQKAGEVAAMVRELGGELVVDVDVFDIFRGGRIPKGFKNIGFRVTYQSAQKTLVSDDVQKLHSQIAESIVKKFEASFQSS